MNIIRDEKPTGCIVYIDGYNWYHAIFKHHPEWKWLDIYSFFKALKPREEILYVKVFSAMKNNPTERERQERYFKVLRLNPKVKIILGIFQERTVKCRGSCEEPYVIQEEKKTDVNMAVEIVSDAAYHECNSMYIVTADCDVQPAVEWVAKNRSSIRLNVYVPALPQEQDARRTDYYRTQGLNVGCNFLPLDGLTEHQFKGAMKLDDGTFCCRPSTWVKATGPT